MNVENIIWFNKFFDFKLKAKIQLKIVTKLYINYINLVNMNNCILGRMETKNSKSHTLVSFIILGVGLKETSICLSWKYLRKNYISTLWKSFLKII